MYRKLIDKLHQKSSTSRKKITIVGDSMIDEYYQVTSNRISPEFPIPILKSKSEEPFKVVAGGAANVIRQLEYQNVESKLVSILDPYSYEVFNKNINVDCCIMPWGCMVPRKKRFYHEDFPLVRWDCETDRYNLDEKSYEDTINSLEIPKSDIIVFSAYGKGIFYTPWYKKYLKNNITIVDPKKNGEKWQNCTIFKPNSIEAQNISGKKEIKDQLDFIMKKVKCKAVIITQSGKGLCGCVDSPDNYFEIRPKIKNIDVRSVIGAGDCFTAFLALSYSHGFSLEDCSKIAFNAGISYVKNKHNETVCLLDLLESCEDYDKIIYNPSLLKTRKTKLAFTNGCFDILHEGHLQSLKFAKSKADKLVVAVNSDASVKRLKGKERPINNIKTRMNMLASLDFVDYVVSFEEDTPLEIIKNIKPDVLIKSYPYNAKEIVGSDLVSEKYICPKKIDISTTSILEKYKN
jgi:D-beta-D-heptose 7-phosphate kinase/D-beta-D-heptose 1-phosphate adenosyltransferase